MNKEKQYIEMIRVQEQIIKDLRVSNGVSLIIGFMSGFIIAGIIATLILK
jgi:tetrahydromethanopterin S-methyltransferase subunit F